MVAAINQTLVVENSERFFPPSMQRIVTWIQESYELMTELFARVVIWFISNGEKPQYVVLLELENQRLKNDRDFYFRDNRLLSEQLQGMRGLCAAKDLQIQAIHRQLELARA